MNDYYQVGKIVGSHGLQGEVVLQHALGKKTDLKGLSSLFVDEGRGAFLPYFIEYTKVRSETEVLVKLEGLNTPESARRLNRRDVWMLKSDFERSVGKSSPIGLLGYTLFDGKQQLGDIIEVIEQPMQVLCKIIYQGNEALIPLHEDTLSNIDHKKRQVIVALPEGLLDIYTS